MTDRLYVTKCWCETKCLKIIEKSIISHRYLMSTHICSRLLKIISYIEENIIENTVYLQAKTIYGKHQKSFIRAFQIKICT